MCLLGVGLVPGGGSNETPQARHDMDSMGRLHGGTQRTEIQVPKGRGNAAEKYRGTLIDKIR